MESGARRELRGRGVGACGVWRGMRILASNPDTIGDMVLRQPMYSAWLEAGHELALVVQPVVAPAVRAMLAQQLGEGWGERVRVIPFTASAYASHLKWDDADLDPVAEAARAFDPDLFVVAPYQWTRLEERLAYALPRAGKVVMTGRHFADPNWGPAPASRIIPTVRVEVAEELSELEKNRAMCSAVLGKDVELDRPRIRAGVRELASAREVLDGLGIKEGAYWIACVGDAPGKELKNWPLAHWSRLLSGWSEAHEGRRFLMVGHISESASTQAVIEGMGARRGSATMWSGVEGEDLSTLIGLIALSGGYVGRDTGPMHMAAALDKPVLAIFGGGHWPRFLPASSVGVSLAVKVACFGCGWHCHLPASYCVKEVPVAEVRRAAEMIESGAVKDQQTWLIEPKPEVAREVADGGMRVAQERLVELSVARREAGDNFRAVLESQERATAEAAKERALREVVERERDELARREAVLINRVTAAEERAFRAERGMSAELEDARREIEALRERAAHAMDAAAVARGEVEHERMRAASAGERAEATALLSRQQQAEIQALREEIRRLRERVGMVSSQRDELIASRWRQYGQKLGLVMTMPWERELRNGTH